MCEDLRIYAFVPNADEAPPHVCGESDNTINLDNGHGEYAPKAPRHLAPPAGQAASSGQAGPKRTRLTQGFR